MSGWKRINFDEDTPIDEPVLVWKSGTSVREARYRHAGPRAGWRWETDLGRLLYEPTHWHPMPEPPEADE